MTRLNCAKRSGPGLVPRLTVAAQPHARSRTVASFANMQATYNTTQISPSITANGTAQNKRTRINLGNLVNRDTTYRLEFDYTLAVAGGWYGITLGLTDSGGTALSGTNFQAIVSNSSPKIVGHYILDFKPVVGVTGGVYLAPARSRKQRRLRHHYGV